MKSIRIKAWRCRCSRRLKHLPHVWQAKGVVAVVVAVASTGTVVAVAETVVEVIGHWLDHFRVTQSALTLVLGDVTGGWTSLDIGVPQDLDLNKSGPQDEIGR